MDCRYGGVEKMKGSDAAVPLGEEGGILEEESFVLQKLSTTNKAVPGRLKGHHLAYEALGAEPYIVGLVKHGYRLVWESKPPPPSITRNNKSVRLAKLFLTSGRNFFLKPLSTLRTLTLLFLAV